jgi:hypothetical protein
MGFGLDGSHPLGGGAVPVSPEAGHSEAEKKGIEFVNALLFLISREKIDEAGMLCRGWSDTADYAFVQALEACDKGWEAMDDRELVHSAEAVARLWAPEITADREKTIASWRLNSVERNPEPIMPEQVLLQLNGLYTLPEHIPDTLPPLLAEMGRNVLNKPGRKLADYDHPVPLFAPEESHELVSCLAMLERDIAFEKKCGIIPEDHLVPVLLSVSVTHEELDRPVSAWIGHLLEERHYHHFRLYLLTEEACRSLDRELFDGTMTQYGVSGAYGRHFTALKYSALLFEKSEGIRASFKLDTDEAICSCDLKAATGKTWFETLCHPYWGGSAVDSSGTGVCLGVNEGEYMNGSDIENLGYAAAMRTPDVRPPANAGGKDLFFQKGYAHGQATEWYNHFNHLEDFISHPVVKGGGYGISNDALRRAVPFTWSRVGRAEDQQFYFSALSAKVRGIFHPDLRIAHYKGSVAVSENKTEATRLAGDMYRLVQFSFLAHRFGVKKYLDPMPGVFAGVLARAQAFFQLLHRAVVFFHEGKGENALLLLNEGMETLCFFEGLIDSGEAEKEIVREAGLWKEFIEKTDRCTSDEVKRAMGSCLKVRYTLD